jgi:hypothetical protein
MTRVFTFPSSSPDGDAEPARDERLGALLRERVGEPPMADVDWSALAERVSAAVRAQQAMPWWGHVERWRRRAVPLALAAGLIGALALWRDIAVGRTETATYPVADMVSAIVSGGSSAEAATSFAGTLTASNELVSGVPE